MMISRAIFSTILILAAGMMSAACTSELDVQELEGRVTSIGPVVIDDEDRWSIDFTITQYRGRPVDLVVDYREDGASWERLAPCPDPESCAVVGGVRGLFTDEDGADTPHRISWDAPAGLDAGATELRFMVEEEPERALIWSQD